MIQFIRQCAFRQVGIFGNASLKEITANRSRIAAYERVGQRLDNPLQLVHLLGAVDGSETAMSVAEGKLADAGERERQAMFWFHHGDDEEEDLRLLDLLDKGQGKEAVAVWSQRGDAAARQNAMVALFLLGKPKQAVALAMQLLSHEHQIRLFLQTLLTATSFTDTDVAAWVADDTHWQAVMADIMGSNSRQAIELAIDRASQLADLGQHIAAAVELYNVNNHFNTLRQAWGTDSLVYQTLADKVAHMLSGEAEKAHDNADEQQRVMLGDMAELAKSLAVESYTKAEV